MGVEVTIGTLTHTPGNVDIEREGREVQESINK
jgi:hypothetical protein